MTAARLAREVGIADGTIFRHFKNKQEIVEAAIGMFESALEACYPHRDDEVKDPLERLGLFLGNRLSLVRKHPEIVHLALSDRLTEAAGEVGKKRIRKQIQSSMEFVRRCLSDAQDRGQITTSTPPTLLLWMISGVMHGAANVDSHRIPGEKDLVSASPARVWKELEKFLRGTAPPPGHRVRRAK